MVTKIAVIGSENFMKQLLHVAHQVEEIEIEPYIYSHPKESLEIMKHLKPCDVIFFSGALPYYISKDMTEQLRVPNIYLQQDETALASSLLSIFYHENVKPERISIDLTNASFVTNVFADIGISSSSNVMDYQNMLPNMLKIEEITEFHASRYKLGMVDLALTSVHAVYDKLIEIGVPAKRMIDTTKSIIQGLRDAKAKAQLVKSHLATVAACVVSFLSSQNVKLELLNEFSRHVNGSFRQITDTSYILYTTRGDIEMLMKTDVIHSVFAQSKGAIALGFGYGSSVKEAEQHAKIAGNFARNNEFESCCYILTDDKQLLGPFPKEQKVYSLKNNHPQLVKIAKDTKLSPANLSKIIQFSRSRAELQFTAADLSDYLQVTRRTAERILKKLVEHKYAIVCGEEMPYQKGRPRTLYEFKLPVYALQTKPQV
ncbi:transcriptional regulator [Bacillus manliponensis]|uniref:Transcriptional regulator n=1 Tax=Bacillus manliponensis TaxID=574376 RepID=A0A073JYI3_9BACI|nr:hypothetical protein [Bacillus manliponensis]KEK19272.1 transcriptional regulator [Bacillus manliponensis]